MTFAAVAAVNDNVPGFSSELQPDIETNPLQQGSVSWLIICTLNSKHSSAGGLRSLRLASGGNGYVTHCHSYASSLTNIEDLL